MAKYHLGRLKKKYGWSGGNLQQLMTDIIATETGNISRAVARINSDDYRKAVQKLPKDRRKRFIIPDVSEVLPKRSLFVRKAADKGKLLTDGLRDRLTKDLRQSFTEFTTKTGEPAFLKRRGTKAGQVNSKLVADFEKRIQGTFQGYTKKDPSYGVPPNVHEIAVTEVRSAADQIKRGYVDRLLKKNPGTKAEKRWIHNTSLSKKPRPHHLEMDGVTVEWSKRFVLSNGVSMVHPHDPDAPASEVISCHCDFEVYLVVPK